MLCGCRTVVFENGTQRAHSVSEHRRPVDNEVGLRFVRASVAVLRKSSSVWHAVAVSHRRAHRQRCTRKANQRRAADGCPTCAHDDKLGNDDDVMTCDITQMITHTKLFLLNAFVISGLWDSTPTGEVSRPRPREQHTQTTAYAIVRWLCRVVRASPHACPGRVPRPVGLLHTKAAHIPTHVRTEVPASRGEGRDQPTAPRPGRFD